MPYALVDDFLATWLPGALVDGIVTVKNCSTELPDPKSLAFRLPFLNPVEFSRFDESVVLDQVAVDIDSYAGSRERAAELAGAARHALLFDLPGYADDLLVVTKVKTIRGPRPVAYDNKAIFCFGASYRLVIKTRL